MASARKAATPSRSTQKRKHGPAVPQIGADVPRDIQPAYRQFALEIVEARKRAEEKSAATGIPVDDLVNIKGALDVLEAHPRLVNYLDNWRARMEATAQALGKGWSSKDYHVPGTAGFAVKGQMGPPTASTPQDQGVGLWGGSKNMPVGVPNPKTYRLLAEQDEWVRAAIDIRKDQVSRADIDCVTYDETRKSDDTVRGKVMTLMEQPNERRETFPYLMQSMVEDLAVLDRGVFSKNMSLGAREPLGLYIEDGASIKIYPGWTGDPAQPHYLFEDPDTVTRVPLRNDECIVFVQNPGSYRLGLSPVQSLIRTIDADMKATEAAARSVSMKPPPHLVQLPGASMRTIEQMKTFYDAEIMGQKEIYWMGGDEPAKVFPLVFSAKDNQWLEWQVYLARKIAIIFKITPQQLGITFDVNKSTAGAQQQIFEDSGLIPILCMLEDQWNNELLADFCKRDKMGRADFDAINLRIMYPEISETARILHVERMIGVAAQALAGLPSMTLNQVLAMRGEEPVPGGNGFYVMTSTGPMMWTSYDGEEPLVPPPPPVGEQDPAGGPSNNQEQNQANKNPPAPQPPGGNAAANDADTDGSSNVSAGDGKSGDGTPSKALREVYAEMGRATALGRKRTPGKKWLPPTAYQPIVPVTKSVKAIGRVDEETALLHHVPKKQADAQLHLSSRAQAIFEDVARAGRHALKSLDEVETWTPHPQINSPDKFFRDAKVETLHTGTSSDCYKVTFHGKTYFMKETRADPNTEMGGEADLAANEFAKTLGMPYMHSQSIAYNGKDHLLMQWDDRKSMEKIFDEGGGGLEGQKHLRDETSKIPLDKRAETTVHEFLLGDMDRNPGNYYISEGKGGKNELTSIDHGMSFYKTRALVGQHRFKDLYHDQEPSFENPHAKGWEGVKIPKSFLKKVAAHEGELNAIIGKHTRNNHGGGATAREGVRIRLLILSHLAKSEGDVTLGDLNATQYWNSIPS